MLPLPPSSCEPPNMLRTNDLQWRVPRLWFQTVVCVTRWPCARSFVDHCTAILTRRPFEYLDRFSRGCSWATAARNLCWRWQIRTDVGPNRQYHKSRELDFFSDQARLGCAGWCTLPPLLHMVRCTRESTSASCRSLHTSPCDLGSRGRRQEFAGLPKQLSFIDG